MIVAMPRDGATIFSDLIGKLDLLRVSCDKCGRDGRYGLRGRKPTSLTNRAAEVIEKVTEL
jgi:hypothetical protein